MRGFQANDQGDQSQNYQKGNYQDKASYKDRDPGNQKNKDSYRIDRSGLYVPIEIMAKVEIILGSLIWRI